MLIDRNKLNDMFNVINEDFNWIIEDITQYNSIFKDKMMEYFKNDQFDEADEIRPKYEDIKKIIEKVESVRLEYISLYNEEVDDESNNDFIVMQDWTDISPKEVQLFEKRYFVKSWREIFILLLEELIVINPDFIKNIEALDEFRGRTRLVFSYDDTLIDKKLYKKLTNGLYVLVNNNANTIVSLCKRVLTASGNKEEDIKIISIQDNENHTSKGELKLETDESGLIKLPRNYASISIDKEIFKQIIYSILDRKNVYGTDYISPRKIKEEFDSLIATKTKYTTSYHVVINIIKYLMDFRFIDNYPGTKKGKYVVIDDSSLKLWVDNNL